MKKISEMTNEELERRALELAEKEHRRRTILARARLVLVAVLLILIIVIVITIHHGLSSFDMSGLNTVEVVNAEQTTGG